MYRKSTLRRMTPEARELAKLSNEMQSALNRFRNRLEKIAELELKARAMDASLKAQKEADGDDEDRVDARAGL